MAKHTLGAQKGLVQSLASPIQDSQVEGDVKMDEPPESCNQSE